MNNFKKILKETITTGRPNHTIILGEWGIGKTSLLKIFKKIVQTKGFLATYCAIPRFTEKDSPIDVIDLIIEEMLNGFPVIKKPKKLFEEIEGIGISIAGFGGQVTRKKKVPGPQIVLTDVLKKLWKHIDSKLAVVLIDDIQNFNSLPQAMDILRLVLSREEIISETKYLFVLSCTPQGWDFFLDKHDPIGRFFRKKETISHLSEKETEKVILETLKGTGVRFSQEISDMVYTYTMGHPYELQVLCSNLYEAQIKGLVSKKQWLKAFEITISDLGEEYFHSLYRKTSGREESIIRVLCSSNKEMDVKEIQKTITQVDKRFPIDDVRFYNYRLIKKGIVKEANRGKYRLIDNMFREYLKTIL